MKGKLGGKGATSPSFFMQLKSKCQNDRRLMRQRGGREGGGEGEEMCLCGRATLLSTNTTRQVGLQLCTTVLQHNEHIKITNTSVRRFLCSTTKTH